MGLGESNTGPGNAAERNELPEIYIHLGYTSVINDIDCQCAYMPGINVQGVQVNSSRHIVG